jgi:membrane protein
MGKARMKQLWAAAGHILEVMDRLNLSLIAAGVGFFAMLALFPALAAIVLLLSWFADPGQINALLLLAGEVVPPEVHRTIMNQVAGVIAAAATHRIGWATLLSLLVAFWSARAGVSALIRGLNAAHEIDHRPGFVRRYLADFGLTLILCALTFLAIQAVVVAPVVMALLPLGPWAALAAELSRWMVAIGVIMLTLGIIYRFGPNRRGRRLPWITPGAIVATVLWMIVSLAFGAYLRNFAHYNEVYGSLGAAVALLMWFYLSAFVVLLGGCLNAAIEAGGADRLQRRLAEEGRPPPAPAE